MWKGVLCFFKLATCGEFELPAGLYLCPAPAGTPRAMNLTTIDAYRRGQARAELYFYSHVPCDRLVSRYPAAEFLSSPADYRFPTK